MSRRDLIQDSDKRRTLLASLYDDFEKAYVDNHLAQMIHRHRPFQNHHIKDANNARRLSLS